MPNPPAPTYPVFQPGYDPQQADFTGWWYDNAWFFQSRVVFRGRQTVSTQSLPAAGTTEVIAIDTIDEDPFGGWSLNAWYAPYPGWYQATITLQTAAVTSGAMLRPGITGSETSGLATQLGASSHATGAEGQFTVYLIGGGAGGAANAIQATASLQDSASAVSTSIAAGVQSSLEIVWLSD